MGQYLCVQIVGKAFLNLEKYGGFSMENVERKLFNNDLEVDLDLYDVDEGISGAYIVLKSEVLKEQLIPLMKAFNIYLYGKIDERVQKIFDDIAKIEDINWKNLSEYIRTNCYMEDCAVLPYYCPEYGIRAEGVVLACSEKIVTEGTELMNDLFTKCLKQVFSDYKLAKALNVNVLG